MVADVELNGVVLGAVVDQHLRYTFEVAHLLRVSQITSGVTNVLTITFPRLAVDPRNDKEARFMACSGGWDWSQYSEVKTPGGLPTLSFGIWKSVYFVPITYASLRSVTSHVFYEGAYPVTPLVTERTGPWIVNTTVSLVAGLLGLPMGGIATVSGSWAPDEKTQVLVPAMAAGTTVLTTLTLRVPVGAVELWWPNAVNSLRASIQPLYQISVLFSSNGWEILEHLFLFLQPS